MCPQLETHHVNLSCRDSELGHADSKPGIRDSPANGVCKCVLIRAMMMLEKRKRLRGRMMARKTKKQRTEEQRVRQAEFRKAARKARRPDRDDIARMLLWLMISGIQARRTGNREMLDELRNKIVDGLETQGFDPRESEEVFEDLVQRYANGVVPFRRKLHLKHEVGVSEL